MQTKAHSIPVAFRFQVWHVMHCRLQYFTWNHSNPLPLTKSVKHFPLFTLCDLCAHIHTAGAPFSNQNHKSWCDMEIDWHRVVLSWSRDLLLGFNGFRIAFICITTARGSLHKVIQVVRVQWKEFFNHDEICWKATPSRSNSRARRNINVECTRAPSRCLCKYLLKLQKHFWRRKWANRVEWEDYDAIVYREMLFSHPRQMRYCGLES